MARNGVWELREVVLRYCASSGSSRGVREFVEHDLISFASKNPQVEFQTKIQGGHPCVFAKYGRLESSLILLHVYSLLWFVSVISY